jgi:spermidine synthase
MVIQIARNPQLFTYLEECAEQQVEVVTGDARLSLEQAEDAKYDVIVMDAYSSDAIPIHLITREALALYVEKLAPGGVLAFHVSNRYLNLKPVLAALAHDAGLVALQRDDMAITEEEKQAGKNASQWVMLARSREHLKPLTTDSRWRTLEYAPGMDVWTDDFASIFSVFSW